VGWATYGDLCSPPKFSYTNSDWTLWCFTKDALSGVMKVYRDGQLLSWSTNTKAQFTTAVETSPPTPGSTNGSFHVGQEPQTVNWNGTIDELGVFSADLSPQDVNPQTGNQIPGVIATRFTQMYDMGTDQ
jgi:hypothetical protein